MQWMQENQMQNLEKHVNFETENSRKAYCREFKKVLFPVVACCDNPLYFPLKMNLYWPFLMTIYFFCLFLY